MAVLATQSRVARSIAVVGALLLLTVALRDERRHVIAAKERAHAFALADAWFAEARALRCPRPALREPAIGDGSPLLRFMLDRKSVEAKCLSAISGIPDLLTLKKLSDLPPHPEIVEQCAALYADIDGVARATEACSPMRAANFDFRSFDPTSSVSMFLLNYAVGFRVAPLVAEGRLADAARHVIDAMRFAQDSARGTFLLGSMLGVALIERLANTLDEILGDPRLTPQEARAIAHDLDVLIATQPSIDETIHQEVIATTHAVMSDGDEVAVPAILSQERWLHDFERACSRVPMSECVERLDTNDQRSFIMAEYIRKMASAETPLRAARMQAELRTLDGRCGNAAQQHARLAPLQGETILLGNVVLQPPWTIGRYQHSRHPHFLRCVDY